MKRIYFILFLSLIFVFSNHGFAASTRIVKGKIIDKNTNTPVGLEIQFEDARGKKFKIKSNPQTGEYEQLLNAEEKYTLTFIDISVLREEIEFTPEPADASFEPQIQDFYVTTMQQGALIADYDIFDKGSTEISSAGHVTLENLKKLLRINRALYIAIDIHSDDSGNKLNSKRMDKVKEVINTWGRLATKVKFETSTKKGANKTSDMKISVDKVEDSLK